MAENKDIVLDLKIQTANSAQSIKEMRTALKALIDEQANVARGTKEWKKLADAINDTEGRIGDLNDSFKTLSGSGIERASSSFGLLKEGFKSFDFEKIKIGFSGVGAAMKAIPIFLIAEGVSYLIENWKELSEGNGILAKTLQGLSKVFEMLGDEIDNITDTLGLTNTALEKQGDLIKDNAEKQKEALSTQMSAFDRQIAVAKAAGKSTVDLEKAKQQAIIDTNLAVARQIEAFVRAGGEFDEEKRKLLTASLEAIKGAKVQEYVIEQEHTKKLNEEYKKRADEKKKHDDEIQKQADDLFAELSAKQDKELADKIAADKKLEEDREKLRDQMRDQEIANEKAANAEMVANWEAEEKRKEELDKAFRDARFKSAQEGIIATQALTDLAFIIRLNNVKKGSAEEEKILKRQFEINKALQIANTVISGTQGVVNIMSSKSALPEPAASIFRGVQIAALVATTAASVAKIASTKFGGGGSVSAPSLGSVGDNTGGGTPTTQAPTTQVQPFTRLDEEGNVTGKSTTVKAYVVESEMTDSQKRVGRLEGQASFG